jgi:hypothetical protein
VRRLVTTGVLLAALAPAGAALATTPPDSTEPESTATAPTGTDESAPMTTQPAGTAPPATTADTLAAETTVAAADTAAEPALIYDDSGNPVASVTLVGVEPAWSEYEEGNDPEAGREYVRVTVLVESLITEGTFGINIDQFILQDNNGFVTTAAAVPTVSQAEGDEEITEEAELANGESVELPLTFEVVSSVGPQSVFYRPDDERLVDVAELG